MARKAITYGCDSYNLENIDKSSPRNKKVLFFVSWVSALSVVSFFSLELNLAISPDTQSALRIVSGLLPAASSLPLAQACWVRYHTLRQTSWMLASEGFSVYCILSILGMVTLGLFGLSENSDTVMSLALGISQLAAGVLMAAASFSKAVVPSGRTRAVAVRSLLTAAIGTILTLTAISGLDSLAPKLTSGLAAYTTSDAEQWEMRWRSALHSFHVAGLFASCFAFVLAVVGFWRKAEKESGLAQAFPYWLAAMAISGFLQASVAREGSFIWIAPALIANIAAVYLLCAFGVDAANAYRSSFYRTIELQAVHAVSSAVVGTKNVQEAAQAVVKSLTETLGVELAAIFLAKGENSVKLVAASGNRGIVPEVGSEYPLISEARSGFHTSKTALAFREQRIIVVKEALTEVDFVPWRLAARVQGYVVCVPLVHRSKCLGVLDLLFTQELIHLGLRDTLLSMIAGAIAPAMEERMCAQIETPVGAAQAA